MNETTPLTTWCFQCGATFDVTNPESTSESDTAKQGDSADPIVGQCRECGVPTSTYKRIEPEDVGTEDEIQMAYEFHEWSVQGRFELHKRLSKADIAHSFEGVTLIVREADEKQIDDLITEIEFDLLPTLDHEETILAYEIDELDKEQHGRLIQRLDNNGIAYAFDRAGVLFVYAKDEETIDTLLTTLDEQLLSERTFGDGIDGDQGAVMSDLYLNLDRLSKRPTDAKAVVGFVETFALAERMKLPYGVAVEVWAEVIDHCTLLRDDIAADSELSDTQISDLAGSVAQTLRKLV